MAKTVPCVSVDRCNLHSELGLRVSPSHRIRLFDSPQWLIKPPQSGELGDGEGLARA